MTRPRDETRDVAVVGGGLAGITAALRLADGAATVTVLEAKPRLGGLTTSFTRSSRVGPLTVDTGQHVFLRCCTSYLALLDRLGVRDRVTLQPRLDVPVLRIADGRRARLRRDALPVLAGLPWHLARSLLGYRVLGLRDRLAVSQAIRALGRVDPDDPATDALSFGGWLTRHGQSAAAIELLWELIGVATLNARAEDASLALAATVFRTGLWTRPKPADIGWAAVPLGELHGTTALESLREAGAEVRLRARVTSIVPGDRSNGWTVTTNDGDRVHAAAVVVAADPVVTERLLPPAAIAQPAGWSRRLGTTPILNAHFVVDRRVLEPPLLALPGSPLQFLFDRSASSGLHAARPDGQHVVASISAADSLAAATLVELRERLVPELCRALPGAGSAQLLDFFVTREPHATWRQAPGQSAHRPQPVTRLPGLLLAGAHTATGWPATMEGAVRSGNVAAAHLLAAGRRSEPRAPYPSPTPSEDAAA